MACIYLTSIPATRFFEFCNKNFNTSILATTTEELSSNFALTFEIGAGDHISKGESLIPMLVRDL
jgi:hypothetical protein